MHHWINYIGIPYDRYNCWELIRLIYLDILGIDLGSQDTQSNGSHYDNWLVVPKGKEHTYDVLLFKEWEDHRHVGLVIKTGRFIHTRAGVGSSTESYKASQWAHRLKAIYRHKLLTYTVG